MWHRNKAFFCKQDTTGVPVTSLKDVAFVISYANIGVAEVIVEILKCVALLEICPKGKKNCQIISQRQSRLDKFICLS